MNVPGALTAVPVDQFGNVIDRDSVARFDPRVFEGTRPVLEPFSNALLRQASLKHAHADERRGFRMPPGLAKKLDATQVYASAPPPGFRDNDRARRFRVDTVPEKEKREKLKFDDRRQQPEQAAPPVRAFEQARGRGNKHEEKAEQRAARGRDSWTRPVSPEAERVAARAEERARGERAAQQRQAQAANERQQRAAEQQQQRFEARRQAEAQVRAQRQAAQQQRRMERPQKQPRPVMQAPPGQARKQQAPAGGPPPGGGGRGQGQGHGGGKGKGKP